ncbi:MAG: hypothetical protein O0V67_00670 [Methanocorpusculum sp.]|nr:hypothetical protein [Methanocorpusculum sp.]
MNVKLLLCYEMRGRRYACFAVLLAAIVFAAVCIAPVTADEFGHGEAWTETPTIYGGPMYGPADFTIAASGCDLSPEDLFEQSNVTLSNYISHFGRTVAPVALSSSSLPLNSLNLRKNLSVSALSASPGSEGYMGLPGVEVPEGQKLAAYGFQVLPTGQIMEYTCFVSADANDTAYAAAKEDLNEWLNFANEKVKIAGASIVDYAANVPLTLQEPGWIAQKTSGTIDYGEWGTVKLTSNWYWDDIAQNEKQDQFYVTAQVQMTPGQVTVGGLNFNQNHKMLLRIDPCHGQYLPNANACDDTPGNCFNEETVQCSIGTGGVGLAWIQKVAEVKVSRDAVEKWSLSFTGAGSSLGAGATREKMYTFKAGMRVVSSKSARNGDEYCISKNSVDAADAFSTLNYGILNGPSSPDKIGHSLSIRWNGEKYKED